MANKTGNVLLSLGLLLLVAVALWGVPKLPSLPESTRIIELPCKPPPSLLLWWDRDNVWSETDGGMKGPAKTNLEYWHAGEFIASRKSLHAVSIKTDKPYVAWRAVIGGEVYITLGGPPSEAFKDEIRRCERLPVVFDDQRDEN